MKINKIYLWALLCVLGVVIVAVLVVEYLFLPPKSITLLYCPTEIAYSGSHPGNNRQHNATVWLGCYNQQLYYFGGGKDPANKTQYDNSLFVFQNSELVEVSPLSHGKNNIVILGIVDKFIYYWENGGDDYTENKLYSFNLESCEQSLLFCGKVIPETSVYVADDGSVSFPLMPAYGEIPQFVHVLGQSVLGIKPLNEGYSLGESTYYVVRKWSDITGRILKSDTGSIEESEEIHFELGSNRSIIPYADGLLVHNEEYQSLLYRISGDGSVTKLFNMPCLSSESAVNIHGTDAYVSVLRYEKYGEIGQLRYENDLLEGTYRISLIDGSVEKINDMCFDGIYNFDDTCFYCCDRQGNVYKMWYDGTLSPILLVSGSS